MAPTTAPRARALEMPAAMGAALGAALGLGLALAALEAADDALDNADDNELKADVALLMLLSMDESALEMTVDVSVVEGSGGPVPVMMGMTLMLLLTWVGMCGGPRMPELSVVTMDGNDSVFWRGMLTAAADCATKSKQMAWAIVERTIIFVNE